MASTNLFCAGFCVAMVFAGMLAQDMENILDIHCDLEDLIAGSPVTLKDICGEHFQVHVNGITSDTELFPDESFPWKLEISLVTDETDPENIKKSTKIVPIERSSLTHGDNVTDVINKYLSSLGEPKFEIPAGKCDNRDGRGSMRLYSNQSGFDKELSGNGLVRILCDFSGADLRLKLLTITGQPYLGNISDLQHIHVSAESMNTTSDLFYATALANIKVVVEGDVPVVEPADTCVFAIAFLTKSYEKQSIMTSQNCTMLGSEAQIPEITYYDHLLGIPICITSGNTGQDLLQMIMESNENISLCGYYTLVLQVDPMHTLHNELNKCNNYLTFDFYFSCHTPYIALPPAQCEILTGPFGSSVKELFDTRFIYHRTDFDSMHYETHHNIRMFRQDERAWIEIHGDEHGVEEKGFGLLKVYTRYMENSDFGSTCSDLVTEMGIQNAIFELEGLTNELLDVTDSVDIDSLVPGYSTAKDKMDQLNISKDFDGTVSEMETALKSMVNLAKNRPLNEHVQFLASTGAMNATMMFANELRSGKEVNDVKMDVSKHACGVAEWLKHIPMLVMWLNDEYNIESQKHGMEEMMHLVGNLTGLVLHLRHFYPEFTCLEGVLINLLRYVNTWSMASPDDRRGIDLDWMFDVDQVKDAKKIGNEKLAYSDCGPRPNQCVKKLHTLCLHDPMSKHSPAVDNQYDVCKARYLKHQAENQYRIIGLLHIKDRMMHWDMNDKCRNDPIAPHKGPLTIWRLEKERVGYGHGQVIYKGIPTLDNKIIMWKKVSVCTCQECHDMRRRRKK